MYVVFGLSPGGSLKKLKPKKLINWLISQEMLLGKIILRLMDFCCATKQFSATKISNRTKFTLEATGVCAKNVQDGSFW